MRRRLVFSRLLLAVALAVASATVTEVELFHRLGSCGYGGKSDGALSGHGPRHP